MLRSEKKRTEKKQSRKDKKMTKLMENYPWAELTPLKNIQADRHGYLPVNGLMIVDCLCKLFYLRFEQESKRSF